MPHTQSVIVSDDLGEEIPSDVTIPPSKLFSPRASFISDYGGGIGPPACAVALWRAERTHNKGICCVVCSLMSPKYFYC